MASGLLGLAVLVALADLGRDRRLREPAGRGAGGARSRRPSTADVPAIVEQLAGYRRWADPRAGRLARRNPSHPAASISTPAWPCCRSIPPRSTSSTSRLLAADPAELPVLRDALEPHRADLAPKLWSVLDTAKPGDAEPARRRRALALYDPENARLGPTWRQGRPRHW